MVPQETELKLPATRHYRGKPAPRHCGMRPAKGLSIPAAVVLVKGTETFFVESVVVSAQAETLAVTIIKAISLVMVSAPFDMRARLRARR